MVKPNPGYDWERNPDGTVKRPLMGLPKQIKLKGARGRGPKKQNPKMKGRGKTKKSSAIAKKYATGGSVSGGQYSSQPKKVKFKGVF